MCVSLFVRALKLRAGLFAHLRVSLIACVFSFVLCVRLFACLITVACLVVCFFGVGDCLLLCVFARASVCFCSPVSLLVGWPACEFACVLVRCCCCCCCCGYSFFA